MFFSQRFLVISVVILCTSSIVFTSDVRYDPYQVVKTNKGYVRGIRNVTLFANKPYYSFKGIPYAAPPINKLRFKPPVNVKSWSGVLDTFEEGSQCLQPLDILSIYQKVLPSPYIYGDEDCLYINIYTPEVTGKLPVMFFINGGVFSENPSTFYGPDFILNENVILVTFTHRVGLFGYMSLGTHEFSGNMAIKDVTFALRWVNENIENFGGDKNQITICGHTSGATIAHLLTMSEASQHLFQRAIIMSASMLDIFAVNEREDHLYEMFKFAQLTDPTVRTFDDLVEFLQNVDGTYILKNFIQTISYLAGLPRKKMPNYIWSPIVKTPYDEHFKLIETGERILKLKAYNSTIDTMFGYTSKETIFYVAREIRNPSLLKSFNRKYEVQLPLNHDNDIRYETKTYKKIAKKIHNFYFGPGVIVNENTMLQYVDLTSDMWIRYGVDLAARIQAKSSSGKTFLYEFSVDDRLNIVKMLVNIGLPGACVADDLPYLFRYPVPHFYDRITPNSIAGKSIRTVTKLWTNFVKYGDPSIREKIYPIRDYQMNFFNITNNGVVVGKNPRADAMALWDEIYTEYYKDFLKTNILNG